MATFSDQAVLLRCVDQEDVKEVQLIVEEAIPALGNRMLSTIRSADCLKP